MAEEGKGLLEEDAADRGGGVDGQLYLVDMKIELLNRESTAGSDNKHHLSVEGRIQVLL